MPFLTVFISHEASGRLAAELPATAEGTRVRLSWFGWYLDNLIAQRLRLWLRAFAPAWLSSTTTSSSSGPPLFYFLVLFLP
jgi:hypothetical protein